MVFKTLFFLSIGVLVTGVLIAYYQSHCSTKLSVEISQWAEKNKINVDITKLKSEPFQVEYNEKEWQLLLKKLELTRYFEVLDKKIVPEFEFGFNPEYAKELVEHWKTKFNWTSRVQLLNKYPQYKININDTTIHYVHVQINPRKDVNSIPILLIDGWPGSFFGFYYLLDYLSQNSQDLSFSIVVPSIPGYLYSTPLNKPVDVFDTSFLFDALMRYLHGEDCRYFVHGEDWGSIITTILGQLFPSRVNGIHFTMPIGPERDSIITGIYSLIGPLVPSLFYTKEELDSGLYHRYTLANQAKMILKDTGYMHLQATKPDTLGHGLTDSPVGLLAYIMEKYSSWSFDFDSEISGFRDGSLNKFDKDDLLTITTLYWMSNSITSSVRFYKCFFQSMLLIEEWPKSQILTSVVPASVPASYQYFGRDIFFYPRRILEFKYLNLTKYSMTPSGGHFAAFQNSKLVGADLLEFVKLYHD